MLAALTVTRSCGRYSPQFALNVCQCCFVKVEHSRPLQKIKVTVHWKLVIFVRKGSNLKPRMNLTQNSLFEESEARAACQMHK